MKFLHRYINLLKLRCSVLEKTKAFFYVTLFYFLYVFKLEEIKFIKGILRLYDNNGRPLNVFGLNSSSRIYAFIEIFIDDCYNLCCGKKDKVLVFDLGANIGIFPIALYYFGWQPLFYVGVEPMPENLKLLYKNVGGLFNQNEYLIIPMALGEKSNSKKKFLYDYGSSRSLEYIDCVVLSNEKMIEVATISFADFLKIVSSRITLNKPIFFKMDMEGGEWNIYEDLIKFLKEERNVKYIRGELHFFKPGSSFESDIARFLDFIKDVFNYTHLQDAKGTVVSLSGIRK
ncbi:MAG: FkbM family methyltransferase [Candidatus Bilamarchaeaceae archaeon]